MSGPVTEYQVRLDRDALSTPWGVRLQGGRDFKTPLTVQRVFVGSPADGELHRGDILISIENYDASNLSHKQAQDIFKNAGGSISLRVRRAAGPKAVGAVSTPSALPFQQQNQAPRDHMLNRVQASLNEALWSPGDAQGEPDDHQFHSVRDAKSQFQPSRQPSYKQPTYQQPSYQPQPNYQQPSYQQPSYQQQPNHQQQAFQRSDSDEEREEPRSVDDLTKHFRVIIAKDKADKASQSQQGGSGKKWRKPEHVGGPGCLMEPGWSPKPKSQQPPAWSATNRGQPARTPTTPPAHVPVNRSPSFPASQPPQQQPGGRPAWAGSLKASGGPKPWEMQAGESLIPPGEEPRYQAHAAPAPQQPAVSPGGTVVPHKPRVQSMHYGPEGSGEYRQNDPSSAQSDSARVMHSQYNSPLGLYSKANVQDMLQTQTTGMPGQGTLQVTGGDGKKQFNPAQSDVYRLLQEEEGMKKGRNPQAAARYHEQAGPEIQYEGYQDHSVQSPSMQALESRFGGNAEEFGTSDF